MVVFWRLRPDSALAAVIGAICAETGRYRKKDSRGRESVRVTCKHGVKVARFPVSGWLWLIVAGSVFGLFLELEG